MSTVTDYQIISGEHDMVVRRVQELIAKEGYELHGNTQMATVATPPDANGTIRVQSVFSQALVKREPQTNGMSKDPLSLRKTVAE